MTQQPNNRSGNIDGIVAKPATTTATTPARYRGPAGPLHTQYITAISQPTTVRPQPQRYQPPRREYQAPASTVVPAPTSATAATPRVQQQPQPQASSTTGTPKTKAARKSSSKKEGISTIWLVVAAAIVGLAMFSVIAGQIAIAVYAVASLWRRVPSYQSFVLALVMFGAIILVSLIPSFHNVAGNLAVYAFMLLCVGAISLGLEARRDMRQATSD
jgi:hypothetical protein